MMDRGTLASLDALSRSKSLNEDEVRKLAWAIDREASRNGRQNERWYWTRGDDHRLERYLRRGKKPRIIAHLLGRTERAVWRRIYRLGLGVRKAKSSIASRNSKCEGR